MLAEMAQWLVDMIFEMGYLGVFALMAVESSFIPFPSEIVLVPAGYLASKGEMSFSMIFIAALAGSMVGAFINYFGALFIGRKFLERYGRYFFISNETLDKMDKFFDAHGHISTFSGRLIPGVRQLISIPAGLSRMNLKVFTLYTALGAGLWSFILIILGYLMGENEALIKEYLHQITLLAIASAFLMGAVYYYFQRKKKV